ncbi:TlpA family protein disulfide reductase [Flavisolibacter tropicus]|uniref:TlpA family protein disulfide reductase n=1 Tax=Flavisolibacter tropicus TaxID=1492898 RepID=UPI00083115A7|nr:TlpA disulfide reductase family protein [Flavisolibacter tropicus]
MLPILKKFLSFIICLAIVTAANAQDNIHFLTGTITEKVNAELHVFKIVDNKLQRLAQYPITPDNKSFVFAIPKNADAAYRFQLNLLKPNGRHMKVEKIFVLPLSLNANQNYLLNITPSKIDTAKKVGWVLKQDFTKPTTALISGRIVNLKMNTTLSLQKVVNGELEEIGSFATTGDNHFEIGCQVKQEGFYYLSTLRSRTRIYIKPADKLEVTIDNKTGELSYANGSPEMQQLYKWQQLILPITNYGYNISMPPSDSIDLNAYINTNEKLQPALNAFSKNLDQTNPRFLKAFNYAMQVDRELAPMNLLYYLSVPKVKGFRPRPKEFNEVPPFYTQLIQPGKFGNASILVLGEARQFMNLYAKLNLALLSKEERGKLSQSEKLRLMMNSISNDTLKSVLFTDLMGQIEVNNLSEFRETFEPFKKYAKTGEAKATYQSIYNLFSDDTAFIGKSSYNFTLPDTSGRMVNMKDFKGKVVFIDVWATWCGPCKEQFPFYKEIEEEYKDNKNIVFVGISIDREKDREKWLNMIKKESLGGLQLLDDTGKAFARPYQINAIPRFLLIDKQGKWIEIRCPRPESKENLKRYLDKALSEKP